MQVIIRPSAEKKFAKLNLQIRSRIFKKLEFFTSLPNPLDHAEHLSNHKIGQYRFRIGDYRVIFDVEKGQIIVLDIGHRRDIYR